MSNVSTDIKFIKHVRMAWRRTLYQKCLLISSLSNMSGWSGEERCVKCVYRYQVYQTCPDGLEKNAVSKVSTDSQFVKHVRMACRKKRIMPKLMSSLLGGIETMLGWPGDKCVNVLIDI